MDKVHRLFVLFFAVYITIIVFAALRVITAVFLRDTLEAAKNDDDAKLEWQGNVSSFPKRKSTVSCVPTCRTCRAHCA